MNNRRKLFVAIGAAALGAPFGTFAQQQGKVWRIGFLGQGSGPNVSTDQAFREQLSRLGYVEGRNLQIEYRWADGTDRLPELAAELARLKVDVIVAPATTPVAAAKRATSTIPIVMASSGDPVGAGLIASLAHPGGNITGVSQQSPELVGKRLQLLREIRPKATRIAVLALKGATLTRIFLDQIRAAARQMGITIIVQEVTEAAALAGAFAAMRRERAQGLIVQPSPFATENIKRIAELAAQLQLPAMHDFRIFVETGGLMSYAELQLELYRRTAIYVDKIFKGAKPADLPVEQPTIFELFINGKTARALGIKIPNSILVQATQVIE